MFWFVPTASGPVTGHRSSTFFPISLPVLIHVDKILSEYFSPGINRERVLQSLHLHQSLWPWILSLMSMSLLYWWAQNWPQYSSISGLTSSAQRGRISSQSSEMFLFMNVRILLAFFAAHLVHVQSHVYQDPGVFLCQDISSLLATNTYWCKGLFLSGDFLLFNLMSFLLAHISSPFRSLCMAAKSSGESPFFTVLCH